MSNILNEDPVSGVLVVDDILIDFEIPVPLWNAMRRQRNAGFDFKSPSLSNLITEHMTELLRFQFRPPSEGQMTFSQVIAVALNLEIPIEAQLSAAEAQRFISQNVKDFYAHRNVYGRRRWGRF